jgi:hypothetical protein
MSLTHGHENLFRALVSAKETEFQWAAFNCLGGDAGLTAV